MTRVLAAALLLLAAASPQSAVDELLAADRAFSAASAKTDLVSGLTAMFADDVVIPMPPGQFVDGRTAVATALRANADNLTSRTEWTPLRGGISADGPPGFTNRFAGAIDEVAIYGRALTPGDLARHIAAAKNQ